MNAVVNLSDHYRCMFIHIPKTAGTSIKDVFNLPGSGHPPWQYFYNTHHCKWNEYIKFTVIRNPWDRFVSAYCYAQLETSYWHNPAIGIHPDHALLKDRTFDDCIYILKNERAALRHESWHPQSLWVMGTGKFIGKLMVDFILTYENLENDFKKLCRHMQINPGMLPHSNRTKREHYKSYYTKQTIESIGDIYADDISAFSYSYS